MTHEFTLRPQIWGDDLRLPTFVNAVTELRDLLKHLEPFQKPVNPFQSRQLPSLKRDLWYVLQRPADKSRTGLLCIWPQGKCCVFVGHKRTVLLRLRVDPELLAPEAGLTVLAATLSSRARTLAIEDTLMWRGSAVQEKSFTERFVLAQQWFDHYCIADARLLGGVQLQMATWGPLDVLMKAERGAEPGGVWDFQPNEARKPRFLWISNARGPSLPSTPVLAASSSLPEKPDPISLVLDSAGPLVALAKKEAGPEQWSLWTSDGHALGRALIRRLEVSSTLRPLGSVGDKGSAVEVAWSAAFNKWEILSLSLTSPKSRSFFVAPK